MGDIVNIGLIGAGAIGNSYAPAIKETSSARLVAVADYRHEAAAALAEQVDCPAFKSHEDLGKHAKCDAVLICTPPNTHHAISMHFLERGTPVLCEKPIGVNREAAYEVVEMARNVGVAFAMASKFRYVDDVIKAKSAMASGILGDVISLENTFTSRVDMAHRWNSDPKIAGGGVLIDNGTHSVDLVRYLVGPISEVMVIAGKNVQGLVVEDSIRMFVRTVNGVMGSIELSWSYQKAMPTYISIYGRYGVLDVGWKASSYRQNSSPESVQFGQGYSKITALSRQVENFCRSLLGAESLLITPEDAIASVEVIHAAYESMRTGRLVQVVDRSTTKGARAEELADVTRD
jgi:predicted dehydrogenase